MDQVKESAFSRINEDLSRYVGFRSIFLIKAHHHISLFPFHRIELEVLDLDTASLDKRSTNLR